MLGHPLGSNKFIKYPARWFVEINNILSGPSLPLSCDHVLDIVVQSEHLDDGNMSLMLGILLWLSYRSNNLQKVLGVVVKETSILSMPPSVADARSALKDLRESRLCAQSRYLQYVVGLLLNLESDGYPQGSEGYEQVDEALSWRYGDSVNKFYKQIDCAKRLFNDGRTSSSLLCLKSASKSVSSTPSLLTLVYWNLAVVNYSLGKVTVCTELLELSVRLKTSSANNHANNANNASNANNYYGRIYDKPRNSLVKLAKEQLAVLNHKSGKIIVTKQYCSGISSFLPVGSSYFSLIMKSDLAYLTSNVSELQELLKHVQSNEISVILEEKSSEDANIHNLVKSCLLLNLASYHLSQESLTQSYEYFVLSYELSKKQDEAKCTRLFQTISNRFFGQLYNLQGYFSVLQGNFQSAVLQYSKSYSYDPTLEDSLYNYSVLLLKLGKVSEAKEAVRDVTFSDDRGLIDFLNHYQIDG